MGKQTADFGFRIMGKKGQLSIPVETRIKLGLKEGDYMLVKQVGNKVIVTKFVPYTDDMPIDDEEQGKEEEGV
jgi:AbrB family looped-hinge helix DNA binding protein